MVQAPVGSTMIDELINNETKDIIHAVESCLYGHCLYDLEKILRKIATLLSSIKCTVLENIIFTEFVSQIAKSLIKQ